MERKCILVNLILKEKLYNNKKLKLDDLNNATLSQDSKSTELVRESEFIQLLNLVNHFINYSLRIPAFENIFFGFKIDKIVCGDFDFIKVNEKNVVNIEFKDITKAKNQDIEIYEKKLLEQLETRKKILSVFKREVVSIGFIQNKNNLFFYKLENNKLCSIEPIQVLKYLTSSKTDNSISNLSDYLNKETLNISPVNQGSLFLNNVYELTNQQQNIIDKIKKLKSTFYLVEGKAGTGKSLVAFELAEYFSNNVKDTILFFLSPNSNLYREFDSKKFKILTLGIYNDENRSVDSGFDKIYNEDFDILIIDEAQRLYEAQVNELEKVIEGNRHCIFLLDSEQNLVSDNEGKLITNKIKKLVKKEHQSVLTELLRFNKHIEAFIRKLFKMDNIKGNPNEANIDIIKIHNYSEAHKYIEYLRENYSYTLLKPLNDGTITKNYNYDDNGYNVIGKEFENIIIILDKRYFYDSQNGLQISKEKNEYKETHNLLKLNYEILTRVKNKLTILIVENDELYENMIKIKNN
jgi:uncharacterized conserved protein (DUF2075)